MIYAEILAGGSGTRMGNTDLPKQFLTIGTKPIIIHTIEQFLISGQFKKIIVCLPNVWLTYAEDLFKKHFENNEDIILVAGGKTRNETLMNGCKYIEETYGINEDDIIVTHDAVRPFITQRIINDNIKAAKKYNAVDTVIPATDTIIESSDGKQIEKIPPRQNIYHGQTPQSFKIKDLMTAYNKLNDKQKEQLTDACGIFILNNKEVKMVNGENYNIKITTLHDLKIANAIITERKK